MEPENSSVFKKMLDNPQVKGFVKIAGVWELKLKEQTVKIKVIYNYENQYYSYAVSHFYQSFIDDKPNVPSNIIDDTAEAVVRRAIKTILDTYDEDHVGGKWIINKYF